MNALKNCISIRIKFPKLNHYFLLHSQTIYPYNFRFQPSHINIDRTTHTSRFSYRSISIYRVRIKTDNAPSFQKRRPSPYKPQIPNTRTQKASIEISTRAKPYQNTPIQKSQHIFRGAV